VAYFPAQPGCPLGGDHVLTHLAQKEKERGGGNGSERERGTKIGGYLE